MTRVFIFRNTIIHSNLHISPRAYAQNSPQRVNFMIKCIKLGTSDDAMSICLNVLFLTFLTHASMNIRIKTPICTLFRDDWHKIHMQLFYLQDTFLKMKLEKRTAM